jgi:hypothetical protein
MTDLKKYLQQLRALPEEVPIEPELKPERQKQDKKIRHAAGAAPVPPGRPRGGGARASGGGGGARAPRRCWRARRGAARPRQEAVRGCGRGAEAPPPTRRREEQDLAAGAVLQATLEAGDGGASPQEGDMVRGASRLATARCCPRPCSGRATGLANKQPPAAARPPPRRARAYARAPAGATPSGPRAPPLLLPSPPSRPKVYVHFSAKASDGALLHTTRREEGGGGHPVAFQIGKGRRAPRSWELALLGGCPGARGVLVLAAWGGRAVSGRPGTLRHVGRGRRAAGIAMAALPAVKR